MRYVRVCLLFLTTAAFFVFFNAHLPITDPVEGNYALTAKEMLMSGDWLSPRIYGQFWYDKPVMIYWLIIISYKAFGINEFAARFPSVVMSALSISFIYWFADKIFENRKIAFLSAFVLATSLEFWILAKMVITDAALFFFTSVSMATFYLGLLDKGRKWYVIAYLTAGLAVLTKGPVGIVLPGLTIFVYIAVTRQWNLLKKLFIVPGLVLFFAIAGPWYFYMYKVHGTEFVNTFLGLHNYIRATVSEHPEYNVFYYYLVLFPLSMLPWTGIFFRAVISALKEKRSSHVPFLLVWPFVTIVFYTTMATKYPTYVFPAMFPVAIIIGKNINDMLSYDKRALWLWLTVPMLVQVLSIDIGVRIISSAYNWGLVYLVTAFIALSIIWLQLWGSGRQIFKAVSASIVIAILTLSSQAFPHYTDMRSAKTLIQELPKQNAAVASYGNYPTSGVFYSGYLMPNLVDNSQELVPQGVWAGKYTMPTQTVSSFNQRTLDNPETYIIVDSNHQTEFMSLNIENQFSQVATHAKTFLYKRTINQSGWRL